MSRKTILLNGPEIDAKNAFSGGGQGGMVRNMQQYLEGFRSEEFEQKPCFHSVRKVGASRFSFVRRLFSDTANVVRHRRNADGLHIVSQYRTAIYREFAIVLACTLMRLPVLYEVKAGVFVDWLEKCRFWESWMALFVLRRAKVVLCEGQVYVDYLQNRHGIESHYTPNFVLDDEIPAEVSARLTADVIRVLFVGFCYEGKGVFELVDGCQAASEDGTGIELTLVGQEHEDFTRYLDERLDDGLSFTLNRMGRLPHEEVLRLCAANDVFCMPSRHRGEGHTNAVNEAMMYGMVIVSTRHGFLESVLGERCSFFLEELTAGEIARVLKLIDAERDEARERAGRARQKLLSSFTGSAAFSRLEQHYRALTATA
jgi:glycosyltransferase involved in cell wall biosynthesis